MPDSNLKRFIGVDGRIIAVAAITAVHPLRGHVKPSISLANTERVDISEEDWLKLKALLSNDCTPLS